MTVDDNKNKYICMGCVDDIVNQVMRVQVCDWGVHQVSTEFEGYLLYCCKVMVSAAYTHILAIINRMAAEINVNISKIMNWTLTNTNTKLEISFHTLNNHHYLAHKTVVAYYNMQTIVLNTSFKISYSHHDHIILCKITHIHDKNHPLQVGEIKIDLNTLMDRKIVFLPFEDHDKVLQVKIYENPKERHLQTEHCHLEDEEVQAQRQSFLQERYNFLDKINEHQANLKKRFSEKVYNLLKELKNKNYDTRGEHRSSQNQGQGEGKQKRNQVEFLNRLGEGKKKGQVKNDGNGNVLQKKHRISPLKNKYDDLLINSMHNKTEYDYSALTSKREDLVTKNQLRQIEEEIRSMRFEGKTNNAENGYSKHAFALLTKTNDY